MRPTPTGNDRRASLVSAQYLLPFILITSLFFMWGGARAILDVLNKQGLPWHEIIGGDLEL